MGSEKPPRRSGAKQQPAVIDLEATATPRETPDEALNELPDAVPVETTSDEVAVSTDGDASELPVTAGHSAPDDEKPEEIGTAEALSAEPAPEPVRTASEPAPAAPAAKSSAAGALVAGLIGGLVALAGAGGLQYAGYLPVPGVATQPAASADAAALETEIAALKSQISGLAARPALAPADNSALEARIAALEAAPSAAAAKVDLAPLQEKIAGLDRQVSQLEGAFAGADERQQSIQTGLLDRLQKVEADVDDPARRNAVARAIAASGLKAAIDRGGSYVTELETFAGVASGDPAVAGLTPYAETGVPTRAALLARFPEAADAVLAVLNRPDPDQGVAERLWASALSLVKIRPVGQVEGDTPEAFIARCEEALKKGDLETALAEWNRLPQEGRDAAADFGKALAARIEVEKLVGVTLRDAVLGSTGK